ncbi:MAG: hypothetical protein ACK4K9_01935 [Bacteroidia bacterium]
MSDYLLSNFRLIPTESDDILKNITLSDNDVLTRPEDQRVRLTNLSKAISLAKSKKVKTFITIKDNNGQLHKFNLNISGFNTQNAITNKGYQIPLKCIFSVDFL